MAVKFLERDGRLEFTYNALPSPKEYVREDADGVSESVRKSVSWEFDLKRCPVDAHMEKIVIQGQPYEHVSYSTVPWESVQDFDAARRAAEPMRGRAIRTVDQVAELDRRRQLIDANATVGTRTRGSAAQTLARNTLRGLRSGLLIADWYCPKGGDRGRDVCDRVGLAFGVSLNIDDWKNAGRRSRNSRLALSGAEMVLEGLGIRQVLGFGGRSVSRLGTVPEVFDDAEVRVEWMPRTETRRHRKPVARRGASKRLSPSPSGTGTALGTTTRVPPP
jgi:hypothetical protein